MRAHSRGGVLFVATCNLCGFTCRVGWASCMRVGSVLSFLGEFSPAPLCVAAWPSRWQGRAQVWGAARLLCRGLHPFCMGPSALHILWRLAALLSPSLPSIPAWQLRVSWRRVALPCVGHPQVQLQPDAPVSAKCAVSPPCRVLHGWWVHPCSCSSTTGRARCRVTCVSLCVWCV